VISEANVGLMQAVKRFDPEKGFPPGDLCDVVDPRRDPGIHPAVVVAGEAWHDLGAEEAVLQPAQGQGRIGALEDGDLRPENVKRIAHDLGVTEDEVISMNRRLSGGDASLNAHDRRGRWRRQHGRTGSRTRPPTRPTDYAERDELDARRALLEEAMDTLNERERDILTQRRLSGQTR
jgi:RNA polymerase sigma-32 factor